MSKNEDIRKAIDHLAHYRWEEAKEILIPYMDEDDAKAMKDTKHLRPQSLPEYNLLHISREQFKREAMTERLVKIALKIKDA